VTGEKKLLSNARQKAKRGWGGSPSNLRSDSLVNVEEVGEMSEHHHAGFLGAGVAVDGVLVPGIITRDYHVHLISKSICHRPPF
jgi:hypothetical protein